MDTKDFLETYHLETYLLETVCPRFHAQGYLTSFDFFCIIIWKANRAKSKLALRLLNHSSATELDSPVKELSAGLFSQPSAKKRMQYLTQEWGFLLPMASAILAVLYPEEFTVYDYRVCSILNDYEELGHTTVFEKLWEGYLRYREAVIRVTPLGFSLRNRDRYLWGMAFVKQLESDLATCFNRTRNDE